MTSSVPLQGLELVSCAKANAKQGLTITAKQCGYGENIELFQNSLKQAGQDMGVDIEDLSNLITAQQQIREMGEIEIAPDTTTNI
jgi:hypothetical protein